jgi:histidinol-phosphatase (PHP family)
MRHYDQHVHSRHSFDSEAEPAAVVECAIARGLAGVTFTEHFDTHPDDWEICVYNDETYSATVERLRAEFRGAIFIGKGIEICYQPDRIGFILDFLAHHDFDMVMLSVHYFGCSAVHQRENWTDVDPVEGTRRYFETVLDAARFCERLHRDRGRVFDVLGHLDVVKRYTQRFHQVNEVSRFGHLLDQILGSCIAAGVIPEVNTSTLRDDLAEPMPSVEAFARYVRLGGTAVSLGSDAHVAQNVGAGFDRAVEILRTAGVGHVAHFEKRERILMLLD